VAVVLAINSQQRRQLEAGDDLVAAPAAAMVAATAAAHECVSRQSQAKELRRTAKAPTSSRLVQLAAGKPTRGSS
jgi:hypothetical protein